MGWLVFGRARKSLLRRATSIIATTALTVMPMLAYAPAAHATDYTGGDASYQTGGIFGNDGGHYGAPGGGGAQSTTGYYAAAGGAADAGGQGGMAVGGATGGNGGGAGGVGYYFTGGDFIVDGNITGGNGAAGLGGNFGPTNSYTGTGGGGGGGSGIWATGSGTITILQGESVTGGQGGQGNYSAGNGGLAGYTYTSTNGQGGHGIRADTATALTIDNAGSISGGSFMLGPAGGLGGAGIYGQNITLTNTGTITGGQDRGISAHAGVELTGGINVINNTSGTITSSTGGAAILIDGGTNAINISGGNITPGAYANAINVYGGTNIFNVTGGGVGAIYLGGGANTLTGSGFSNSVTLAHGATASIDAAQDDASGITTFDNYGGLTIESGRSLTVSTFTNENSATLTLNSGAQLIASTLNLLDGSTIAGAGTLSSGVAPLALSSGSISATVGGTGGLVKSGTGTLTLTGANTYTGGTTVDGGTLSIADGALGGGDVTLAEGTTIQFTGSSFTTTNDFHITGDPVFDVATGDTQTVSGVIDDATPSNPGIVEKTGNGTLVLSGANTYSGGTMIVAGILQLGVDSVFNTLGDPTSGIVSSAIGTDTLTFGGGTLQAGVDTILANAIDLNTASGTIDANGHDISLAGLISGTHGLSIVGSSGDMVTFANAGNSFSGGIDVTGSGVTISESANGDFGSGLVTLDGAGIKFNGADTYTNTVNVSGYSTFDLGGNAVTYTGLIADGSGPGAVMVSGGGTLTLKNTANSYTGGTYIFGGSTASIDSDGELGGTAGGVTLGDATTTGTLAITQNITSARTITLNIGGGVISAPFGKTLTLSGQVTGSGGLTVSGPGGVFLTGSANNYSGGTTIASGSVTAGRANVLGTGPLAIKAAGLLDLNNRSQSVGSLSDGGDVHGGIIANSGGGTAALTIGSDNSDSAFSGVIVSGSGTISLVKAGTGTLTLSGANTYSGGTTIGAGTLQIGVDSVFNTPGDPTSGIASSAIGTGTLTLNGGTLKTDAITTTLANDIVLGAGGTIDANAETLNLRGDITGSGALTITSSAFMPGAYIELGGNNTYSGATTISQGRVVALSSTALSASSDYSLTGTSSGHDWPMIDLNGFSQTIKSLTGNYFSYGVTNNGGSNATLTIAPGSGSTTNYGGGLSDGNTGHHSLAIVLDGASDAEQIFSSNFNTYSGGTTITSGILGVGASNALGTGAVYLDGGTLRAEGDFSLGNAFEVTRTGSTIDANGHSFTLGAISNTSGNELATLTFASSNGAGTVNLMSSEDFDGAIVIESSATVTQGTSPDNADVMTIHDLTLDGELQVTNARISKVSGSGTITNNAATSGAVTFDIDNGTETFAGTLADAAHGSLGVVKAGAGTLALSGNNTYSGGTAIDAGTIEAQSSSALGTGNVLIDGGKLRYDNGINLANAVVLGGDVAVDVEGSDTATQSGTVGDDTVAHTLTKTGTGTLTLSSANTYSGTTKLSAGTLEIDNADALGASQIVFDGGTLKVDGAYTIANDILIGANGGTFDTSTFDTTLSGTISDGGSGGFLAVSGTGKVTITGDNELSAGTDVAAGGTLVGADTVFNTPGDAFSGIATSALGTGTLTFDGGTLQAGGDYTVANAIDLNTADGTIDANGHSFTLTGLISGTNALTITDSQGGGEIAMANLNTYSGGTTVSGATALLQSASSAGASALGTGTVVLDAGTLKNVSGRSSFYVFPLALGAGGGTLLANNGTLLFTGAISDNVASAGGLTINAAGDTGTVSLSGNNTYTGGTTIAGGTLAVTGGTAALGTGLVEMRSDTTLKLSNSASLANNILLDDTTPTIDVSNNSSTLSGNLRENTGTSGGFTKTGVGTLVLAGLSNNYSSASVQAGTLELQQPQAVVSAAAYDIASGAHFKIDGSMGAVYIGALSGAGDLTVFSGTQLNVGGAGLNSDNTTFSGVITADYLEYDGGGTLTLSGTGSNIKQLVVCGCTNSGGITLSGGSVTSLIGVDVSGQIFTVTDGAQFTTPDFDQSGGTVSISDAGTVVDATNGGTGQIWIHTAAGRSPLFTVSGGAEVMSDILKSGLSAGTVAPQITVTGTNTWLSLTDDVELDDGTSLTIADGATLTAPSIDLDTNASLQIGAGAAAGTVGDASTQINGLSSGTSVVANFTDSATLDALVTGALDLNVQSGNLTLTNAANDYSGGTTIGSNGVLTLQDSSAGTGAIVSAGVLAIDNSAASTFAYNLSGTGDLAQIGGGALTINGAQAYTGSTVIAGNSTLLLTGAGDLSHSSGVEADGTFDVSGVTASSVAITALNGDGDVEIGSKTLVISGTGGVFGGTLNDGGDHGSLTLLGSQTLNGVVSLTGTTTIGAGATLTVNGPDALGSGTLDFKAGSTLKFSGSGTYANPMTFDTGAPLFDVTNQSVIFSGLLGGPGDLAVTGANGTLTLTNTGNTYAGGTEVYGGATLNVGADSELGTVAPLQLGDASTNGTLQYGASFALNASRALTLNAGGGTIDTNGFDATIAQAIGGAGDLTKTGTGTLMLTGVSTYTGATAISGGTLLVNGSIAASSGVTVASGGTLGGKGTVSATTVASGGTIAPGGNNTLHVSGTLALADGSTTAIAVTPTTAGQIAATGAAALDGKLAISQGAGTYAAGSSFKLISASSVTGTFDSVTGATFSGLDSSVVYSATGVSLDLAKQGSGGGVTTKFLFDTYGKTPNQIAAGKALAAGDPAGALYVAMGHVVSADTASVPSALGQLAGDIHASLRSAAIEDSRVVRDIVIDRIGAAQGDAALWASGFGGHGNIESDGNASGLHRHSSGFLVGADMPVAEGFRLGLAGGYTSNDASAAGSLSTASGNSTHVLAYAGWSDGAIDLKLGGDYGWGDVDVTRHVTALSEKSGDSQHQSTGQVFGEAGYIFPTDAATLEPYADIAHIAARTGSFSEKGGLGALSGDGKSDSLTYSTLGVRATLASGIHLGDANLLPKLDVGWQHAFDNFLPAEVLTLENASKPFTVLGVPLSSDALVVRAGLGIALSSSLALDVGYDGEFSGSRRDNAVRGDLRWAF